MKLLKNRKKRRKEHDEVMSSLRRRYPHEKITPLQEDPAIHSEQPNDEESSETDQEHVNNPFIDRLTQAERNKIKRRKIHEAIVKKNYERKLQSKQKLEEEKKEHENMKKLIEERNRLKELKKKQNENNPKKLGREKIPETDIAVLLPDEVPKSLREIKPPTTSLIEDRFHSFQKRNMIEPRKVKEYERRYSMKLKFNIRHREFMDNQDKKYPE